MWTKILEWILSYEFNELFSLCLYLRPHLAAGTLPPGAARAGPVAVQVEVVAQPGVVSPVQDRQRLNYQ